MRFLGRFDGSWWGSDEEVGFSRRSRFDRVRPVGVPLEGLIEGLVGVLVGVPVEGAAEGVTEGCVGGLVEALVEVFVEVFVRFLPVNDSAATTAAGTLVCEPGGGVDCTPKMTFSCGMSLRSMECR